ncbi:MAG: hypothetical protein ACI85O_002953 [Saprospiraceae bacterium]|jgi:hypothetical protein
MLILFYKYLIISKLESLGICYSKLKILSSMLFFEKVNSWARGSIMLKLLMVGFLMLVLLIPSGMISSLI